MTNTRSSNQPKTVLLAFPHRLIRESLAELMNNSGFNVTGQASTIRDIHYQVKEQTPDIILLMGDILDDEQEIIEELSDQLSETQIVLLKTPENASNVMETLQAGASGYLSANLSPDDFMNSLMMIADGSVIVSKGMTESSDSHASGSTHESENIEALSEREREVLVLIAVGATNQEIADKLIITENTVKVHLRNILNKLDLRNRQQAAAYAAQEGIVENIRVEIESSLSESN